MDAVARNGALVVHRIKVGCAPVRQHRPPDLSAVEVVGAPVADVGIDELRPQTHHVLRRTRFDIDVELQRDTRTVGGHVGLEGGGDGRSMHRQPVEDKARLQRKEPGVGQQGVERDWRCAMPLRSKPRILGFEANGPDGRRIGRRRHPAVGVHVRLAGEDREIIDAKPLLVVLPVDPARGFIDQKRQGVGIVEPNLSRAHDKAPGQALDGLVWRETRVKLESDRSFGE